MLQLLSRGWKTVLLNKRTLSLVSLYHLAWTILFYFLITRILSPLLRAIPTDVVNNTASQYFWLESKFLIAKTNLLTPYLFLLFAIILLRMLISPILLSGIFGVLTKSQLHNSHNNFMSQVKENWKAFSLLYWLKSILIIVPTIVVCLPIFKQLVITYYSFDNVSVSWLSISMLIVWVILIRSIFYSLLIGISSKLGWQQSLTTLIKQCFRLLLVFLIIYFISITIHAFSQVSTVFVTGLISSIIFYILPVVQTFLRAWTISTHIVQFNE